MDFIVLDIEFNGRKFASDLPMEVIEIGAVRLNPFFQQTDVFTALIKPVYFSKLNNFIKKKTGIPQEEIDQADGFPKVIAEFTNWLYRSDSFLLVTWGGEDIKRIVYDARMHKQDDGIWTSLHYFDLLKGFLRYKNLTNDVSVEAALLELGIDAAGSAHRALDDALMTSEILRKIHGVLDFGLKQQYKDMFSNSKERRWVKNAIRAMRNQKVLPEWGLLVEHYLKDKVSMDDSKKLAELQEYFMTEKEKGQR